MNRPRPHRPATPPTRPVRRTLAALSLIATVAGCATSSDRANLSQLEDAHVQFPAVNHRYALRVEAIDGTSNTFRQPLLSAGRHEVRFSAPPVALLTQSVLKTYTLDIQPCTRYYPVAQRASAFDSDWHLVIERVEPIGGPCSAPGGPARADAEPDGVSTPQPIVLDAGRPYPG